MEYIHIYIKYKGYIFVCSYIVRRPQNFTKSPPWICPRGYVLTVKSTAEISQNFVAFSECMNFIYSLWKRGENNHAKQHSM